MSLIYKREEEEATLGQMIEKFPDQWNDAVELDTKFWLKRGFVDARDLIIEVTDAFDDLIGEYQLDQILDPSQDISDEELDKLLEQNPVWHYDHGSIDENDVIAVLKIVVV